MRYVAFLRAINVGGHIVKMDRLRALFEELGLTNVETFIASGNVIFDSRATAASLEKKIEAQLFKALGYEVATFIRPSAALAGIASGYPLDAEEERAYGLYIGFLKHEVEAANRKRVEAMQTDAVRYRIEGRELYQLVYDRETVMRLSGSALEKAIGAPTTMRNINTVRRLAAKLV